MFEKWCDNFRNPFMYENSVRNFHFDKFESTLYKRNFSQRISVMPLLTSSIGGAVRGIIVLLIGILVYLGKTL